MWHNNNVKEKKGELLIMKKTLQILTVTGMVFGLAVPSAFANEDIVTQTEENVTTTVGETENTIEAGTTPDEWTYFLERFFENVELTFTFDEEKKTALLQELSLERLAELEALPEAERVIYLEKLIEDYTANIEEIEEVTDSILESGEELPEEIVSGIEETTDTLEEVVKENEEIISEEVATEVVEKATSVKTKARVIKHVPIETITTLRIEGLGYGEIAKLYLLMEKTGLTTEEILVVYNEQGGMGQTIKSLGFHPSELKGKGHKKEKGHKEKVVTEKEEVTEETPEVENEPTEVAPQTVEQSVTTLESEEVVAEETKIEVVPVPVKVEKKEHHKGVQKSEQPRKQATENKQEGLKKAEEAKQKSSVKKEEKKPEPKPVIKVEDKIEKKEEKRNEERKDENKGSSSQSEDKGNKGRGEKENGNEKGNGQGNKGKGNKD